jgi:parvulin-like peptidyl-prolyl isomerase
MKNKMKRIFSAALGATLLATAVARAATANEPATAAINPASAATDTNANPSATMAALFGDPVIAKGKGFEIKQSELDEVMLGIKSALVTRGESVPPDQMTGIEAQMLDRLIQIQLLLQKANDADKADGKKKADAQIALLLDRAGSQETFDRQLKAVGMTEAELRKKVTEEAVATAALTRELGVTVTPDEMKQFYDSHPADFEQPETAHIRHILLLTIDPLTRAPLSDDQQKAKRKQIDDILKRARSGEDFAALAKQYSEDPGSKDNGGELPAFARDNPNVPPEFEAAAFSLNTNQISDVITMSYGYDIMQLIDKTPAKKVDYASVTDKIKDYLTQQKVEKLAPAYLASLKKAADAEILDPSLKAAAAAAATNAPEVTP